LSADILTDFSREREAMKIALIALAAAFGIVFSVAETGFAQNRPTTEHGGKLRDKGKRSLPLRIAPRPAPETRGGTLEESNGKIIYF
jgi:hypothetical protein